MTLADPFLDERFLHARVEVEQPQGVRDRRLRAANPARDLVVGEAELGDQGPVRGRGLDRAEVGPLEVLDQGHLELVAVGELSDHGRDPVEPGESSGTEATLAGDELVAVERLRHEDRLQHAVLADAGRKGLELIGAEALPRLTGVRLDPGDRDLGDPRRLLSLRDQGGEAATQTRLALRMDGHARTPTGCAGMSTDVPAGSSVHDASVVSTAAAVRPVPSRRERRARISA